MAKETYRIDIPITTKDEYSSGINRAKREVSKFEQAIEKTNQKLDRLTRGRWSMTLRAVDRASSVIRSVSNFAARSINRSYHITIKALDLATRPIRGIARMATSTLGLLGMGGGIAGGIVIPLKMVADRQNMTTAFEVLLGSAEAANKRVEELITFAGQTPFTRDSIFEASRILEVFTKGALSTGDGLKMVGDIAAGTQQEFTDVALWVGRMYDSLSAGRPVGEMTSRLQEMGAISGDARDRIEQLADSGKDIKDIWPQVTKEFERYDDMMVKMSDNLANLFLGVKSFFMNNVIMKWGDGLARAFQPSLERFREWRGENSAHIQAMGKEFDRFGEAAANGMLKPINKAGSVLGEWFKMLFPSVDESFLEMEINGVIDPMLQQEINEMRALANQPFSVRFQMVIDDFKENHFNEWMETLREKVPAAAQGLGETYGNFIRAGILTILGDDNDGSFASIGGEAGRNFVTGLIEAIDPWDLTKRIIGKVAQINADAWKGEGSIAGAAFANALILAALAKLAPGLLLIKSLLKGVLNVGGWLIGRGRGRGNKGVPPVLPGGGGRGKGGNDKGGGGGGTTVTGTNTGSRGTDQNPPKTSPSTGGSPVIVDSKGTPINSQGPTPNQKPVIVDSKGTPVRSTPQTVTPTPKPSVIRNAWDKVTSPIKTGIDKVRTPVKRGVDKALEPLKKIGEKIKVPKGVSSILRRVPLLGTAIGALSIAGAPEGERAGTAGGVGGAIAGGAAGAALGSVVPGVGTVIGGIGGSILGGIFGEKAGSWLGNKFSPNKAHAAEAPSTTTVTPQTVNTQATINPLMQQMQMQGMASAMQFNQAMQKSTQTMTMFSMFTQRLTMMLMQGGTLLTTGIQRSGSYMNMFSIIVMQITMAMMSSGMTLMKSIQQSAMYMQMFSVITMQMTLGMMGSGMMLVMSIQQSAMSMQLLAGLTLILTTGFASSGMALVFSLQQSSVAMQMMSSITMIMTLGMMGSGMQLISSITHSANSMMMLASISAQMSAVMTGSGMMMIAGIMQSATSFHLLSTVTAQTSMMTMTGGALLMGSMYQASTGFMTLGNIAIMSGGIIFSAATSVSAGARLSSASFYRLASITNMAGSWVMSINGIQSGAASVKVALSGLARRINSVQAPRISSVASGARPTPYANGGMITRPHVGLVGEAGPEMIVPLSTNRRSRALNLYDQLGKMLGVGPERAYANGGVVGKFINNNSDTSSLNGASTIPVADGVQVIIEGGINPTVSVVVQGSEITDPDELADSIADKVAEKIAKIMEEVSVNMPIPSS